MTIPVILMIVGGISAICAFVVAAVNLSRMMSGRGGIGQRSVASTGNGAGIFGGFIVHLWCVVWLGLSGVAAIVGLVWFLIERFA